MKITARNAVSADHRKVRRMLARVLKSCQAVNRTNGRDIGQVTPLLRRHLLRLSNRPAHYRVATL